MRILMLTHAFNSLSQRLFVELERKGYEISVEFDIHDSVTREAVSLYRPDLILAPYLRRAIPEDVWSKTPCFVVHPGIPGDRGPSSLDWAILEGERDWGVTVFQANAEMDAGRIFACKTFAMREAPKSSLYRREVTEAAVESVLLALERFQGLAPPLEALNLADVRGRTRPYMTQEVRAIDWTRDTAQTVLRKIHASDGSPGVLDTVLGQSCYLFDANVEQRVVPAGGEPGTVIARSESAILRATSDGKGIWIGHLRSATPDANSDPGLKLPAGQVLKSRLGDLPAYESPSEISYEERQGIGYLQFDFHNGAMSTAQCERLRDALRSAVQRPIRVLVLLGGQEFWSNGIHLHQIEAAPSPAEESWSNIQAMNDVTRELLLADRLLTVSALGRNAGAGGVFLALAADQVWAGRGVVLNPHYKSMGNLYGSEYWTYSLPLRTGSEESARRITENRLPLGAVEAAASGLVDQIAGPEVQDFRSWVELSARELAQSPRYDDLLASKGERLRQALTSGMLENCREHEMEKMKLCFFGFDPSYHRARYQFVHRVPHSRTPRHLARHR